MDKLVTLLQRSDETTLFQYVAQNWHRVLSDWAYAFGSSNMGALGSSTLALAKVLENERLPAELGTAISLKIIDDDLKVIYRALTQARPALTLPALSLLRSMARLLPVELTTQFDFTLRIIPKLLTTNTFREAFLQFYIQLVRSAPAHLRKDLLSTRNVFSAWIGKLGQEEEPEIVENTLDVFGELVLKDVTTFSKTTKMGLFNDWTLKNMVRLLGTFGASNTELASKVSSFLVMLLCDRHFGVRMAGEHTLTKSFLKIVKPWENVVQLDLVVALLRQMPELINSYFESLAPVYPLTPKASMWWFSFSVLHIRVMKINITSGSLGIDEHSPPPALETISKALLPVTATKTALQQAVQFKDSKLVQFQGAQIVLLALQRLRRAIFEIYEPRKWDSTELVSDMLQSRLPDVHMFTRSCEPELLMSVHLAIVREMCRLRPISINLQLPLEAKSVHGLALVQAQNLLEIQTLTSDQTRWWNPSKEEPSLFTQLLKFATFNRELAEKSSQLLQYLVEPTQLFADIETLAHPVDGLLLSLAEAHSTLVWPLLDQAVLRAVKTPYQYIDQVKSEHISPFAVALVGQYVSYFADRDIDGLVRRLLRKFLRSLVVLGEDKRIHEGFLDNLKEDGGAAVKSEELFNFVMEASDEEILKRQDLVFKIASPLELSATLFRAVNSTNSGVRNYLLASIPEDMLDLLTTRAAYRNFITGPKDTLYTFLAVLESRSSLELCEDLENSTHWLLGVSRERNDFLREKLVETHEPQVLYELNKRAVALPLHAVDALLKVNGIADNILLREPRSVPGGEVSHLMALAQNADTVAALVQISGHYDPSNKYAESAVVLTAAARYAPSSIDQDAAVKIATELISQGNASGIAVLAEMKSRISFSPVIWDAVSDFVEGGKAGSMRSILLPELVDLVDQKPPFLSRWLKIVVLQLTKRLAEERTDSELLFFVERFNESVLERVDIWTHVHANALNALLDASIRIGIETAYHSMASRITLQAKDKAIEASGHLTKLLELPMQNTTAEVVLIYALFMADPEANSTLAVEQGVLGRYTGSCKAVDEMLLSVLEAIESKRQRSWVDNVQSWEIRPARANLALIADDYGTDPLFVLKGTEILVTLDEVRIRQTVQRFEPRRSWSAAPRSDFKTLLQGIMQYDMQGNEDAGRCYDSMFLLNTIVSCEYLLERSELFLTSGLLSFVICCFADEGLSDTAFRLLAHVSKTLEEKKFKDQVGMSLVVNKMLMLYSQYREKRQGIPAYLPIIIGQLSLVLARPSHFLHEKVSGWLLEGPSVFETDVPLFNIITKSLSDSKPRELVWLVNVLTSGAVDQAAVETYARQGVIEWCLTRKQIQSPKSAALGSAVDKFVRRIEEAPGGSETLASRFGALVDPGMTMAIVSSTIPQQLAEYIK